MEELQEIVPDDTLRQKVTVGGEREAVENTVQSPAAELKLTVDEIIEEHVGSFGFSQLVHVFLVSLAWIFDSQNTPVTIFSDAQPSWRCKGGGSWCARGRGGSSGSVCGLEPGSWEWVGGKSGSTVAEWGLVCHYKFRAGLPASAFFLGSILGAAVNGRLADVHLGRKRTLMLSCLLASITGFLTSLSPNVWVYVLLRFSNGFSRSGIGICCLVLSTEVVGRKWRGQVGQYGFLLFTAGFLSLPLIAYPARTHRRNIYRVISLPPLLYSAFILPFLPKSPRWLVIKGRTQEAFDVLNKLARFNGKKLPNNLRISSPSCDRASEPDSTTTNIAKKTLWSARWATKRMITIMMAGFGVGIVYYGVQLNVENLNFNLYFTVALNALMEIPAVCFGSVLLSFTDRRLLVSVSAFVAGVSSIVCIFYSGGRGHGKGGLKGSWAQLAIEGIGFMAASLAFDVLYIFCLELFPTNVRNFTVSLLRQALMLGASIAPLLVVIGRLNPSISFVIFGVLAIFSGLLIFWLPETRNAPLYETLEQQEEKEKPSSVSDSGVELGKL